MNQPQGKSNASKVLDAAINQHRKTQRLIISMEGDSASVARMPNPQGWQEYCEDSPDDMKPSNHAMREGKILGYERLCLNCDNWISWEHMDNYNRVFGFSGYDEVENERIVDHE